MKQQQLFFCIFFIFMVCSCTQVGKKGHVGLEENQSVNEYDHVHPYSRWYGKDRYFGIHYDIHATKEDTLLGTECSEKELVSMLELVQPDFVQTDCKGHPGYTSWFSEINDASVPPKMTVDVLQLWRAATKKLGIPLHCHYSGIYDAAIIKKHPDWSVQYYVEPGLDS
ncbi:MAG: hypothetical protein MI975_04860, partial [Cytophagales bacterium]|nr:hypothetical protein [Cytophagales bacterium]